MCFVAIVDCAYIVVRRLGEMNLVDPFSYHLYIGGAFNISWFMKRCATELSKNGFKVCLKYDLLCFETEVIPTMKYGIGESFRCLLLLTTDFGKDAIDIEELKWLNKKKNKFTDDAVLVFNFTNNITCEENFKEIKMVHNIHEQNLNTIIEECMQLLQRKRDLDLYKVPRENIGIGEAFGYFYGYLRIILPNMRTKFYEKALNNDEKLIKNAAPRYLIIVPEDCKGKIKFDEDTGWFVVTAANRAGVRSRDYKSSVQKITDEQGEEFYFVGEFSTPTVTMYESYIYGKYGLTLDELYQGRNAFFLTLQTLLNEHPETKDSYRLLFWRNISDPENGEDFHKFLLKALKEEISNKENKPQGQMVKIGGLFEIINVPVENPKAIYEKSIYPRSFQVRGLCLSFVYSRSVHHPEPRNGYKKDKDYIENTFQRLQFEVKSHEDLTTEDLKNILEILKKEDWDKYGCVACCFSSHGCKGNILTTDSPISIRCITEYFYDANCPGLKGKPKLFFIQTCLTDNSSQDNYRKIEKATLVPGNPDVLISYSCLGDAPSYRSPSQGSLYLQALHECLQPNLELKCCLDRTNDLTDMKAQKYEGSKFQKPFYVTSLNKPLYL